MTIFNMWNPRPGRAKKQAEAMKQFAMKMKGKPYIGQGLGQKPPKVGVGGKAKGGVRRYTDKVTGRSYTGSQLTKMRDDRKKQRNRRIPKK